jgi:hypothetical protein
VLSQFGTKASPGCDTGTVGRFKVVVGFGARALRSALHPLMLEQHKIDGLTQVVRYNENVNLAVAFEGSKPAPISHACSLLVDCENSDSRTIETLCSDVSRRFGEAIQILTLADARSTPPLLPQVLGEGVVLKDYYGEWDRLLKAEEIECPAAGRERFPPRRSFSCEAGGGLGSHCGGRQRTPTWRKWRRS